MEISRKIQNLTLTFLKTIDSDISEKDGVYVAFLPEQYVSYFGQNQIKFTFDEKTADEKNCELIVPGSKILYQIITNCSNKGPISLRYTENHSDKLILRYHFFVNFSSSQNSSEYYSVDIDYNSQQPEKIQDITIPNMDNSSLSKLQAENITACFTSSIEELKSQFKDKQRNFIEKIKKSFQNDLELFVSRYDAEIRELDESINEKENSIHDPSIMREYRFNNLEKIKKLEKDKLTLLDSLQEKHKVDLNFELIACELIQC